MGKHERKKSVLLKRNRRRIFDLHNVAISAAVITQFHSDFHAGSDANRSAL